MTELNKRTTEALQTAKTVFWNLTPAELVEHSVQKGLGQLADNGALMVDTGKFTGRSPQDRFIVKDEITEDAVWWGNINKPFEADHFNSLHGKMIQYIEGKELYVRDCYVGADENYRIKVRSVNTRPWANLFCSNMFIDIPVEEREGFEPDYTVFQLPEFMAEPAVDHTRQANFSILNFKEQIALVGGSGYTGEMKKGIFSILNFLLPHNHGVLAMHCSANMGKEDKDTAVFFGLSGTGKTTLSADPNRLLIGDDEHGWTDNGIFNFEGGCYAKTIDLTKDKEPEIWDAIKFGAILENVRCFEGTRTVDFTDTSVTENTRVSYPINHIENAVEPSVGGIPKNIFFLTCDAYGILPPISKLNKSQAMYHFISGYTAKVAGTEVGITEPQVAFSACFGAPFMPLHPTKYAELLGKKMEEQNVNIWLVNTGWSGGPYGVGSRIKLKYTRAMITAALNGELDNVDFHTHTIFGVEMPKTCPNVPTEVLSPKATWNNDKGFYEKANYLAQQFIDNFKKFEDIASEEIIEGGPKVRETVS